MSAARAAGLHTVDAMWFKSRDGQSDTATAVICEGDPQRLSSPQGQVDMHQAFETPEEQSFRQYEHNTQALQQREQREQQMLRQQMQAEQQSQGRGGISR
jgi:uncharacterized lipoprotein YmbA